MFRKLRADEIEVRVGTVSQGKGVSLLLYKDARCDMAILDETVGAERWQRKHYECKGNLFCSVGILFESWVFKDDCGKESNAEKEKGEASDSFKRACVNWGIGRELYTAPFIWIGGEKIEWREYKGKQEPKDKFVVTHVDYTDDRISELRISTDKGKAVFSFAAKSKKAEKPTLNPDHVCCICGKQLTEDFYNKSMMANGAAYCSGTCKNRDIKPPEGLANVQ